MSSSTPCGAALPEPSSASLRAGPDDPLPGAGLEADIPTLSLRTVDVVVCWGCCCGTRRKHPSFDHGAQREAVRAAVARIPGARLRVTGCLDLCHHSNVIAIRDRRGRGPARTWWLGGMLTPSDTAALLEHLRTGGALPGQLRRRGICPARPFPRDFEAECAPRRR